MRPEDNPADEAYERDLLLHEIRLLTRVREAAKEWADAKRAFLKSLDKECWDNGAEQDRLRCAEMAVFHALRELDPVEEEDAQDGRGWLA